MARFSPHSGSRGRGFGHKSAGRRDGTSVSTLMAAGAVVWIVVLLGTTARGVVKSVELTRSLADLRAESLSIAAQIDSVNVVLAAQDPNNIEKYAREQLGMVRKGEIVYRVRHTVADAESTR